MMLKLANLQLSHSPLVKVTKRHRVTVRTSATPNAPNKRSH